MIKKILCVMAMICICTGANAQEFVTEDASNVFEGEICYETFEKRKDISIYGNR